MLIVTTIDTDKISLKMFQILKFQGFLAYKGRK